MKIPLFNGINYNSEEQILTCKLIKNFTITTSLQLSLVNFNICGSSKYEKDWPFS